MATSGDGTELTLEEREAFVWLQGRLVDLLLRNYEQHFDRLFDEQSGRPEQLENPALREYNELAVIYYLREELFEEILPLIKRKLSFTAPQERLVEELPARGRLDWVRTAAANWNTFPDEPPSQVHTVRRQRLFATPENLLTVCTLLEYQAKTQDLLDRLLTHDTSAVLRHPLNEIIERCRRELGFLQFAELVSQAERVLAGYAGQSVEELEQKVEAQLQDNYNPAYDRLIQWRRRLARLRLLERELPGSPPQLMLGADPARDNYLYQLWIFYEVADYLERQGLLLEIKFDKMWLRYTWGEGEQRIEYRLQHDQSIAVAPEYWEAAPGVRPDFYIQRITPDLVKDETGRVLWHSPGFVLDAKYYKPRGTLKAPSSPVKRMIADLQLTGERYGALLFAFQQGKSASTFLPGDTEEEAASLVNQAQAGDSRWLYKVAPAADRAQYIQPDLEVNIWRLRPKAGGEGRLNGVLQKLLDAAHDKLQEVEEIKCRAIFLDSLTANAHRQMAQIANLYQRDGRIWGNEGLDDLVLCPKPHISPWRLDLVSVSKDCCKNARLCHIMHRADLKDVTPPTRLTALQDIQKAIRSVAQAGEDEDEEVVRLATNQVALVVERYRELVRPDLKQYDPWLKQEFGSVFFTTTLLSEKQRDTIRLACFLREQTTFVKATNFAGPALLFSGILEELLRNTLFQKAHCLKNIQAKDRTLGGILYNRWDVLSDVERQGLWSETISERVTYKFRYWLEDLQKVKEGRNKSAHEANLSQSEFARFQDALFGNKRNPLGAFNGFISSWI